MTKRRFLLILSSALTALLTVGYFYRAKLRDIIYSMRPRVTPSPTGTLSDEEAKILVALGEVLVDDRDLNDEEKGYLRQHLTDRTETDPGYFALYQKSAAFLVDIGGKDFAQLNRQRRLEIIEQHNLSNFIVPAIECFTFKRSALTVRSLAVPDLIMGYYRSPAGWALVRYDIYPGRCGDLSRYTRPEAEANA